MASVHDFLLQSQNQDGGWGYRVRGMSFVEPTAAALLALRGRAGAVQARARDFLLSIQHPDGGWGIGALDPESGWMTAWAVYALADRAEARDAVSRGVNWLVEIEGLRITSPADRDKVRQTLHVDSALRGWPWQRGDAAWVHPTALALLALAAAGQGKIQSVLDGAQYLLDRAVPSGGWNVGNPWLLDNQIPATIQDTAVALLALQAADVTPDGEQVKSGIAYLRDAVSRANTAAELAWAILALKNGEVAVGDGVSRLNALRDAEGGWLGNPFVTAIALLAQRTSDA